MKRVPSSASPKSRTAIELGWLSREAARASRWNRWTTWGSVEKSWCSILRTTGRSSVRCFARYTRPIPPCPTSASIRNLPFTTWPIQGSTFSWAAADAAPQCGQKRAASSMAFRHSGHSRMGPHLTMARGSACVDPGASPWRNAGMATPTRCPRCGRENDAQFAFCLDCGQPLAAESPPPAAAPLCASCGAPLLPAFRFCGICGKAAAPASTPTPRHGGPLPLGAAGTGSHPPPLPARPDAARIRLALLRNDGLPGPVFSVEKDEALCGRTEGDIRLPDDPTVSPRHARFTVASGVLHVEDLGSVNGTFIRLREPRRLASGEELRVGRQLLRLEPLPRPAHGDDPGVRPWGTKDPGYRFRLSQLLEGGGLGEIFPLRDGENVVGREAGDVTFPADRYVSARHARIEVTATEVTIADAGSSNGTYVKLAGAAELAAGDQLLVGGQLLKVE